MTELLPAGWVAETALECTFDVAYPAAADQTFVCEFDNTEMSRISVLKLTNGLVNPDQNWTFNVYQGGFGGTLLASSGTLGDGDGVLEFGLYNLDGNETYTVCELSIPAGYSSFWQVDTDGDGIVDTPVIPYNPNASEDPPQDLGNRCVDFGAETSYLLGCGATMVFEVDNSTPGGGPRTPGYWKNWNRCTGGGQQFNADRNGGWEEGFWLIEDVLDPSIGGGIVWDDILADSFVFQITTCEDAVLILDQRDLNTGRKRASDAAYTLAMHLLAAQLNFGAGACTTQEALDTALAAEELLDELNFDGSGRYLRPKNPQYWPALELAAELDAYNNGELCGDFGG